MANLLTVLRLVLIPVFVWARLSGLPGERLVAAAVYGVAALTDLFDGLVARKTGTVTQFGRIADPLADRALVLSVLAVLVYTGDVPLWAASVVIGRDVLMVLGYKILQVKGLKPEVTYFGKVATAVVMIALALLILAAPFALLFFYVGMALSVMSGLTYAWDAGRTIRAAWGGED
jgi:CDP-diacylglycerol--glycerol-3-phosphate 3-phosphatidyltransferase